MDILRRGRPEILVFSFVSFLEARLGQEIPFTKTLANSKHLHQEQWSGSELITVPPFGSFCVFLLQFTFGY